MNSLILVPEPLGLVQALLKIVNKQEEDRFHIAYYSTQW